MDNTSKHKRETTLNVDLYNLMKYRRTVRKFSSKMVEKDKLRRILQAGLYAPSGSNKSPYRIYVIQDNNVKEQIRKEAEKVEKAYYALIAKDKSDDFAKWAKTKKLNPIKPFLTEAPILLSIAEDTRFQSKHSQESTWLTIAYLLLAIASEGLATVTYTPEPHNFIKPLLKMPEYLSPQVILPIGYSLTPLVKGPRRPKIEDRVINV